MAEISKLYQLLEYSAERFPDHTAVICDSVRLSYSELNFRAGELAQRLRDIQILPGDRVALFLPKSISSLVSLFGILKSGAAYLPVDHSAPLERSRFIIEDCEAVAVILPSAMSDHFKEKYSFVCDLADGLILVKNNKQDLKKSPADLAYVLYTSGSTGVPKGVMYSNSGALAFVNWCTDTFSLSSDDRFSSHAPFHFDLSVFDIFVSVKSGASLVLIREEIAKQPLLLTKLIADERITTWYSTPSVLTMISEFGKMEKYDLSSLKNIFFAGEVFPVNKFNVLRNKLDSAEYYNLYGPTETNVCTWYKVPGTVTAPIPIGKVCPHYEGKVLDEELLISGKGIMLGYWMNAGKDPFYLDPAGKKWYRTGDLVEEDAQGNYIFKGRRDRMVKRNGYRIELDEVEAALSKHPGITSCAVVHTNTSDSVVISAVVVAEKEEDQSLIRMKEYCMQHLPSYMIPNDFIFVKALPYTSSHKIDYQKLTKSL